MAGLLMDLRRQIAKNRRKNQITKHAQKSVSPQKKTNSRPVAQGKRPMYETNPNAEINVQSSAQVVQQDIPENRPYVTSPYAEQDAQMKKTVYSEPVQEVQLEQPVVQQVQETKPYVTSPYAEQDAQMSRSAYTEPVQEVQEPKVVEASSTVSAPSTPYYQEVPVQGLDAAFLAEPDPQPDPQPASPVESPLQMEAPVQENSWEDAPVVYTETRAEKVVDDTEDAFLAQIDEFRERARQLRTMMSERESKAEELRTLVDERKEQADSLEQIVQERQEQADSVSAGVEKQIDALISKVGIKMDEIEQSMQKSMNDMMQGDLEETRKINREQTVEMKESLGKLQENLMAVKEEIPAVREDLSVAKSEISEKIHTENVKCYRNLQDLFKTIDVKVDKLDTVSGKVGSVKRSAVFAVILGLLNLVAIVGIYLMQLGIISF